ncbi:MAG: DUF2063 domain-containing protein [Paracoccaceae bacterium]
MIEPAFRSALLDPDAPPPANLRGPGGEPAGRRFAVYRNNVAVGLTEALETQFPVLRKLVGEDFFKAMAGIFLRQHPPSSPVMAGYGAAMPDFLAAFGPAAHLGYLPDVARLELAILDSYHAADAPPLSAGALARLPDLPPESTRLALSPSARLVRSPWPVFSIWAANTRDAPAPARKIAEDIAVLRRGFDPEPCLLPLGGGTVLAALLAGEPLAVAAMPGPEAFAGTLSLLLGHSAVTGILHGEP